MLKTLQPDKNAVGERTSRQALALRAVVCFLCVACLLTGVALHASTPAKVTGKVVDPQGLAVADAAVTLTRGEKGDSREAATNAQGEFAFLNVEPGTYTITARGGAFKGVSKEIAVAGDAPNIVEIRFGEIASQNRVVIVSSTLEPGIDQLNDEIYKKTLFERDDQLLESLGAGINAGQHEGGGKSLEIRRFGFNLDHGGVNGGLKVVVNDLPQNQASQGHGQGYLGR